MARLLSRSYERLNRILNLAGNTALQDIDLESAFATHDLNRIVQSERGERWTYNVEYTHAGANITYHRVDLLTPTDFDVLIDGAGEVIVGPTAADAPDPETHDFLVTHVALAGDANMSGGAIYLINDSSTSATFGQAFTNALTSDPDSATTVVCVGNGEPYYAVPMPYLYSPRGNGGAALRRSGRYEFNIKIQSSAASTMSAWIQFYTALKGTLPISQ